MTSSERGVGPASATNPPAPAPVASASSRRGPQAARTDVPGCLAVQPARRGYAYVQRYARGGARPEPVEEARVVALAEIADSGVPVVAPAGLALAPATPLALTLRSTAEALLVLLATETAPDPSTLTPLYLEPAPATPPVRKATPCPPSPKAT